MRVSDFQHYGVLGMKWGVRKQNKVERKLAKRKEQRKTLASGFNKFAESHGVPDRVRFVDNQKEGYYQVYGRDTNAYKSTKLEDLTPMVRTVLMYSKTYKKRVPSSMDLMKIMSDIEKLGKS